jgi:hypothetical protein
VNLLWFMVARVGGDAEKARRGWIMSTLLASGRGDREEEASGLTLMNGRVGRSDSLASEDAREDRV